MKGRIRKQQIFEILSGSDYDAGLAELRRLPPEKSVNALFPFLYSTRDTIKWHAVSALGRIVLDMAKDGMESARIVVRRLMWNLNDESGGIGWGSPEAMGEILARHEKLAEEYAPILLSYAKKDGNFLELPLLQRGLLWGISRLSEERPQLVKGAFPHLMAYLESEDSAVRGHAARIMGLIEANEAREPLLRLVKDEAVYTTYLDDQCSTRLVGKTAEEALKRIETKRQEKNKNNRFF